MCSLPPARNSIIYNKVLHYLQTATKADSLQPMPLPRTWVQMTSEELYLKSNTFQDGKLNKYKQRKRYYSDPPPRGRQKGMGRMIIPPDKVEILPTALAKSKAWRTAMQERERERE